MITNWFDDDPIFNRHYPLDPPYRAYFDYEWGIPTHNDAQIFEMLSLSGFAAGLNWHSVLNKRTAFRQAFYQWSLPRIAEMTPADVERLCQNPAIIRNPRKIQAVIHNANLTLELCAAYGSFDHYLWQQLDDQQLILEIAHYRDLPRQTETGNRLAKTLRAAGFQFTGPVTVNAWLVTTGFITARPDSAGLRPTTKKKLSRT